MCKCGHITASGNDSRKSDKLNACLHVSMGCAIHAEIPVMDGLEDGPKGERRETPVQCFALGRVSFLMVGPLGGRGLSL